MTCTEFERLLDQQEPDARTLAAMQRHADGCAHCRMLMELRSLDQGEELPETAAARWRMAVRTEQAKTASEKPERTAFPWKRLAPLAAVAAVLVAAFALRSPISAPQPAMLSSMPTAGSAGPAEEAVMGAKLMSASAPRSVAGDDQGEAIESAEEAGLYMDMSLPEEAFEEPEESVAVVEAQEAAFDGPVSFLAAGNVPDETALEWTVSDSAKTARQLLAALGHTGENDDAVDADERSVRLHVTVSCNEWPAFREALAAAGAPEPQADLWDGREAVRLILTINEEENER